MPTAKESLNQYAETTAISEEDQQVLRAMFRRLDAREAEALEAMLDEIGDAAMECGYRTCRSQRQNLTAQKAFDEAAMKAADEAEESANVRR